MEPPIMLALKMIINEEFEKNYLNANNIQQLIDFSINYEYFFLFACFVV